MQRPQGRNSECHAPYGSLLLHVHPLGTRGYGATDTSHQGPMVLPPQPAATAPGGPRHNMDAKVQHLTTRLARQ
eukprot:6788072-Prorocentrum_lima.AAC.1